MLKAVIKQSQEDQIRHRIIPAEAVVAMSEQLSGFTDDIQEILQEEREEKMVSLTRWEPADVSCVKRIWK